MRYSVRKPLCWQPPKPNPDILSDCHNAPTFEHGAFNCPPDYRFSCSTCHKDCTVHVSEELKAQLEAEGYVIID
jgi:hypothetical protein